MATVDPSALGALLRPFVADRVFVLVGAPLRPLAAEAGSLLDLGARHVAIVGDGIGLHTPSERDGLSWDVIELAGGTVSETRDRAAATLTELPARLTECLDGIDPERSGWVINANNACTAATIGGRAVLGRSRAEWTALEDKMVCDDLWDAAGVPRAPYEIVPATRRDLEAAARRLDRGQGTVWSGDARDSVSTGADRTRWVRDTDDVEPVVALLSASCDRARVMPFLEGIPCSIHGVLTVDGVAALRPCEMVVLRDDSPGHLKFVGLGTGWDPAERDREHMRDVARRVGTLLRDRYGFLGTFTVDGIVTEEGFLPTELNPRVGGALALMSETVPELGLVLHTQFLAHEIDTGVRARELEDLVVTAADSHRAMWASELLDTEVVPIQRPVIIEAGAVRLAHDDEERDGLLRAALVHSYAPSVVALTVEAGHLPSGPSVAPLAASAFNQAQLAVGVKLGPFEPAVSVR